MGIRNLLSVNSLLEQSHRRWNPLRREWVLVSPQRTERPWQGQTEPSEPPAPKYDPNCYLCPGNRRANGETNPQYQTTFVFDNDFAALKPAPSSLSTTSSISTTKDASEAENSQDLFRAESESGVCRVLCFSPRHDLTLPRMSQSEIANVVAAWGEEYKSLGSRDEINYVQIFENRGIMMGCSNPHPHGQVWASSSIPNEPRHEQRALIDYHAQHHHCLLCDYLKLERDRGERVVCANDLFTAVVPFWAIWPFETLLLSHRHFGSFAEMDNSERLALADILKRLTTRFDNLFKVSFPYSMGFHQSPTDGGAHPEQHFHAHFYPPLLRSATVRKFMVGYEMLATPQRDITAEWAAARLREASESHYKL
jgi:UDPglucose--hexose-1-phosphate uridylyltransferase